MVDGPSEPAARLRCNLKAVGGCASGPTAGCRARHGPSGLASVHASAVPDFVLGSQLEQLLHLTLYPLHRLDGTHCILHFVIHRYACCLCIASSFHYAVPLMKEHESWLPVSPGKVLASEQ
jgi:hypothetical protein